VRVLGYPVETVLAEKIASAIALGPANTRVRDFADIYTLTGRHALAYRMTRKALVATAEFRGTPVELLSRAIDNIVSLRGQSFAAYRASLGDAGLHLPADFGEVVGAVTAFADALAVEGEDAIWEPAERQWNQTFPHR
jgi:hypothetical protein